MTAVAEIQTNERLQRLQILQIVRSEIGLVEIQRFQPSKFRQLFICLGICKHVFLEVNQGKSSGLKPSQKFGFFSKKSLGVKPIKRFFGTSSFMIALKTLGWSKQNIQVIPGLAGI